jgi:chromosomal replication initiation ATPase DnaA
MKTQMISKNILSQIFKEHNIEVDRISKIRTLQTFLNDTTLDIPLMRRLVTTENVRWILRNILVNNSEHINVNKIIKLAKEVI